VDSSGYLIKHPYINNALNRLLAKWAFKLCTAGGFKIPGFALADDGFLSLYEGQVVAASDWLPQDRAISSVPCPKGPGCALPNPHVRRLASLHAGVHRRGGRPRHAGHREQNGCSMDSAAVVDLVEKQIRLEGTFTLHSETAAKNGGDFDYDLVAVVEGDRSPALWKAVSHTRTGTKKGKTKRTKKQSPW